MIKNLERLPTIQGVKNVIEYDENTFGFTLHVDKFKKYGDEGSFTPTRVVEIDPSHEVDFVASFKPAQPYGFYGLFAKLSTTSLVQGEDLFSLGPFPHLRTVLPFVNGAEVFYERDPQLMGAVKVRWPMALLKTMREHTADLAFIEDEAYIRVWPDTGAQTVNLRNTAHSRDALGFVLTLAHMASIVHPKVTMRRLTTRAIMPERPLVSGKHIL